MAGTKKPDEHRETFHAKRRLGQHFLRDPSLTEKIVALSGWTTSDLILEVGPGMGALTFPLSRHVRHVVAVEKDAELAAHLAQRLAREGVTNVTLVHEDILSFDLGRTGSRLGEKIHVAGNLPYNISSPLLRKLTDNRRCIGRAVLMFQAEFAERLTATPGTKAYGALTLWVRYHAACRRLLRVAAAAFHPRPKVDSVVLELDFGRSYPRRASDDEAFRKILKVSFAHRRKTIFNSLMASNLPPDPKTLLQALSDCRIDPRSRAEALDMEDFLCLARAAELTKISGDAN